MGPANNADQHLILGIATETVNIFIFYFFLCTSVILFLFLYTIRHFISLFNLITFRSKQETKKRTGTRVTRTCASDATP